MLLKRLFMKKIVKKTSKISLEYLKSVGFSAEKIESMVQLSINDMNKILTSLEKLLQKKELNIQKVQKELHALKGLVAQLNDNKLAKEIEEIEKNINRKDLEKLLRD